MSQGNAIILAAVVIGAALYLGRQSINVVQYNSNTATATASSGGGGGGGGGFGDVLKTVLGFL